MGNDRAKTGGRPKPPQCPKCGNVMSLKAVEPDTRHINLDVFKYQCACGYNTETYVARET
jgi:lysyl-tRNA synthetase class I